MKYIIPLLIVTALLFSCASSQGRIGKAPVPLEKITYKKIETLLSQNTVSDALEYISAAKRGIGVLSLSQIETLKKDAVQRYDTLFSRNMKEKKFFNAYKILVSARNADILLSSAQGITENDLVGKMVFSKDTVLDENAKLMYAKKYFRVKTLSDAMLKKIINLAVRENDRGTLEYFLPELKKRSISCSGECNSIFEKTFKSSNLIKGTVTIWVNRGMKIENGMGLPERVIGSGFFIDKEGYLLTNYHVIDSEVDPEYEGYSRLYIRLSGKPDEKIPAKVVGWDKIFDLALLKVPVNPSVIFYFGSERKYDPGTHVFAIGSPGGLENTITSGIVSANGRKFLQMGTVMQIDVPVNHGNSGGPLLDMNNNLIGIVFAGIEQFEGVNFAIPEYYAAQILPQLYTGGKMQHPYIGAALSEKNGILSVTYVVPGSPAARAGIQPGDTLLSVNNDTVDSIDKVQNLLLKYSPHMIVKLSWKHGETRINGLVSLDVRPDIPAKEAYGEDASENLFLPLFGMKVESVSTGIFSRDYIITHVTEGSIADNAGLSVNDPFSIQKLQEDTKHNILRLEIRIKKRKSGFLESGLLLSAPLETNDFI